MATLAVTTNGAPEVIWGIPANEKNLVTQKITIARKVEKKELRNRIGDYKAVMSYNQTFEVNVAPRRV